MVDYWETMDSSMYLGLLEEVMDYYAITSYRLRCEQVVLEKTLPKKMPPKGSRRVYFPDGTYAYVPAHEIEEELPQPRRRNDRGKPIPHSHEDLRHEQSPIKRISKAKREIPFIPSNDSDEDEELRRKTLLSKGVPADMITTSRSQKPSKRPSNAASSHDEDDDNQDSGSEEEDLPLHGITCPNCRCIVYLYTNVVIPDDEDEQHSDDDESSFRRRDSELEPKYEPQ